MEMISSGGIVALAFAPILMLAISLRRRPGASRSKFAIAVFASTALLLLGAGVAQAVGVFG